MKKHTLYMRKYRKKYPEKIFAKQQKESNTRYFGGNRFLALERDGHCCRKCGMSEQEHLVKFGTRITVDHIDGNGRHSAIKNHALENLQTLCRRCHGEKDAARLHGEHNPNAKLTFADAFKIRQEHSAGVKGIGVLLARRFRVSPSSISRIVLRKSYRESPRTVLT